MKCEYAFELSRAALPLVQFFSISFDSWFIYIYMYILCMSVCVCVLCFSCGSHIISNLKRCLTYLNKKKNNNETSRTSSIIINNNNQAKECLYSVHRNERDKRKLFFDKMKKKKRKKNKLKQMK